MSEKNNDKIKQLQDKLLRKRENNWKDISHKEAEIAEQYCRDYLNFSAVAKSVRKASHKAIAEAEAAGFKNLDDINNRQEKLKPGSTVYRCCRDRTVMLARIGRRPMSEGLFVLGAHTDAPRLDGKPNPLYEDSEMALLDTHYYGGIKKYQWVTMPLAIHGMIVRGDGSRIDFNIGEDEDDPVFVVTDLLPHLAKDQSSKKLAEGVPGENLNVLFGSRPIKDEDTKEAVKLNILQSLNDKYGITEEDLSSAEIEIVPAGKPRELGLDRSMMLAYAHDDRISAYASLRAILDQEEEIPEYTSIVLLCDKEEIGSVGATGMESTFFENSIAELMSAHEDGFTDLSFRRCLEHSKVLSADVCAAHDPNYPDVSAPNNNMPKINGGTVLTKYTGSRGKSHASEATAEFMGFVRKIFNDNNVNWQTGELGKVDQGGGGTIAMFLARYGMDVIDCGPPLLSMHAPWEVAGKLDAYMTYKGFKSFLSYIGE